MPRVPGSRALAFASRWFDHPTVARVFEPLIADWQREWQDAAPSTRTRITAYGLTAFLCAVIVSSPRIALTRAPSTVTDRVATRIARFTFVASLLLSLPFVLNMEPSWVRGMMILFAVPGILASAFPFSVVSAVDAIRSFESLPPQVERALAAKLGLLAFALMVLFGGWVVPAANQQWRAAMAPPGINVAPRGIRELTTYELLVDPSPARAGEITNAGGRTQAIRRELITRASSALLPVLLIWLRWGALDRPRRRWYSPLPASLATAAAILGFFLLWFVGVYIELARLLPFGIGMWVPTIGLITAGLATRFWARGSDRFERHDAPGSR